MTNSFPFFWVIITTFFTTMAMAQPDAFDKIEQLEKIQVRKDQLYIKPLTPPPADILKKRRVPVILQRDKKIWDLKQDKMVTTHRDLNLEIYDLPDSENFYYVVDPTRPKELLFKVHIEDIKPLHPIDQLAVEPAQFQTHEKIPFITKFVPALWYLETHFSIGYQKLNNRTLNPNKSSGSVMRTIEMRGLFAGVPFLQVGGDLLLRQSFFTSQQKNFDHNGLFIGPMFRIRRDKVHLHGELLKSLSSQLHDFSRRYTFNNYLIQGGLEYLVTPEFLIGLGYYRELFQLKDEYTNRPSLEGMVANGFYINIGLNWSGLIL